MNRSHPHRRLTNLPRLGVLIASAALVAAPALQAAPPKAATGTIKGRLVYGGTVPDPKVEVQPGDPKVKDEICKVERHVSKDLIVDPATKGVAEAFAYLVKPSGDYSDAEKEFLDKNPQVVIDQVKCEFVPYVAVVHKDQKLVFKSSDPVGHNVHVTSFANGSMNSMLNANGSIAYPIKKEDKRPTPVVCDIHPWMKGFFLVADSPFATVTKPDGSFEITGVPAGPQTLIIWQSSKGFVNEGGTKGMKVEVKAGETKDIGDVKFTK